MRNSLQSSHHLLQIGATGRNSGKTAVAKRLIQRFKKQQPLFALKIITITGAAGRCQRGLHGCGICTSINTGYELTEEQLCQGNKDTMLMLQAGCQRVFLLKAFEADLWAGYQTFLAQIPLGAHIICESNSLRRYVKPEVFIMMDDQKKQPKATAAAVLSSADVVLADPDSPFLQGLTIAATGAWQLPISQEELIKRQEMQGCRF